MRMTFTVTNQDTRYTRCSMFIDYVEVGTLTILTEDWEEFQRIILDGPDKDKDFIKFHTKYTELIKGKL